MHQDDYMDRLKGIREKYGCSQPKKTSGVYEFQMRKSLQPQQSLGRNIPCTKSSAIYEPTSYLGSVQKQEFGKDKYESFLTDKYSVGKLSDQFIEKSSGDKYEKYSDKYYADRLNKIQSDKYADKYTDKYADKYTDKYSDRYADKYTDKYTLSHKNMSEDNCRKISFGNVDAFSSGIESSLSKIKIDREKQIEQIRSNYAADRKKVLEDIESKYTGSSKWQEQPSSKQNKLDQYDSYRDYKYKQYSKQKDYLDLETKKKVQRPLSAYYDEDNSSPIKNIKKINDEVFAPSANKVYKDTTLLKDRDLLVGKSSTSDSFWRQRQAKLGQLTANKLNEQRFTERQDTWKNQHSLKKSASKRSGIYHQTSVSKNLSSSGSPMKKLGNLKQYENSENLYPQTAVKNKGGYSVSNIDRIQQRIQSILGK